MWRLAVLGCLAVVTACSAASPATPTRVDQQVVLAPWQTVPVAGGTLALRLLGVPADSRCPADAMCVHAGSARVDVHVTTRFGGHQIVSFETADPQPVRVGSLTLELVQLAPYPASAEPISPAAYRATVRVRR